MTDQPNTLAEFGKAWDDITAGIRRAWKAGMPSLAALAEHTGGAADELTAAEARTEMLRLGELLAKACDRADKAERERDEERAIRQQAEEIIGIAHDTSNRSERERAAAIYRAETAERRHDEQKRRADEQWQRAEQAEAEQRRLSAERDEVAEGNAALDEAIGAERRRALAAEAAERRVRQVLNGKARLCGPDAIPMVPVDAVHAALDAEAEGPTT